MKLTKNSEIYFRHDWDSLFFWQEVNWRDFTFIHFSMETNCYSKNLEVNLAILGLHLNFYWYKDHKKYEEELQDLFDTTRKTGATR